MGGYGALHLAFRHPQLFSAVSAHSPAIVDKLPAFTAPTAGGSVRSRVLGANLRFPARSRFLGPQQPADAGANRKFRGFENLFRLRR